MSGLHRRRNIITDYYETLGIPTDATLKDINNAYKKLALKHHPDKRGEGNTSHNFQKIQEAVEILRDPIRRSKHDEDLGWRRTSRQEKQSSPLFDPDYTGWRPHNPWWWNLINPREKYMFSYRHSVHMDPSSPDSREELARCERERQMNEEIRATAEAFTRDLASESKRKGNMNDDEFLWRGDTESPETFDTQTGENDHGDGESLFEYEWRSASGDLGEDESGSIEQEEHSLGGYATAASQSLESDSNSNLRSDGGDRSSSGDGEVGSTATDGTGCHDHDGEEEEENCDSIYYDFSDMDSTKPNVDSAEDSDDACSTGQGIATQTSCDENYGKLTETYPYITPFVPYFVAKLSHESGRYTKDDLCGELRGMVMETYCGWLEGIRLTILGTGMRHINQNKERCRHLGFWKKEFGAEECEQCQLWMPIYTLKCPGCGIKACVSCKFRGKQK